MIDILQGIMAFSVGFGVALLMAQQHAPVSAHYLNRGK
jgi:hypothetical protein